MRKARALSPGTGSAPRRHYAEAAIALAVVVLVALLAHAGAIAPVVARVVFALVAAALVFDVRRRAQTLVRTAAASRIAAQGHRPRR